MLKQALMIVLLAHFMTFDPYRMEASVGLFLKVLFSKFADPADPNS